MKDPSSVSYPPVVHDEDHPIDSPDSSPLDNDGSLSLERSPPPRPSKRGTGRRHTDPTPADEYVTVSNPQIQQIFSVLKSALLKNGDLQSELSATQQSLRLHEHQLSFAQSEIRRAEAVVKELEERRVEAVQRSARARDKTRKLIHEIEVWHAREEGKQEGYKEGLEVGRMLWVEQERRARSVPPQATMMDYGSVSEEPGPLRRPPTPSRKQSYREPEPSRHRSMPIASRDSVRRPIQEQLSSPPVISPLPRRPGDIEQPRSRTPRSTTPASRPLPRSAASSPPVRPPSSRSSRHRRDTDLDSVGYPKQPSYIPLIQPIPPVPPLSLLRPPTPAMGSTNSEVSAPESIRPVRPTTPRRGSYRETQTGDIRPVPVRNVPPSPSASHRSIVPPPDGYIPVQGSDGYIRIPPPHDLAPSESGSIRHARVKSDARSSSRFLSPMASDDDDGSSRLSQYDLISSPKGGGVVPVAPGGAREVAEEWRRRNSGSDERPARTQTSAAEERSRTPSTMMPGPRSRTPASTSQRATSPLHHRVNSTPTAQLDPRSHTPSGQPGHQRSHTSSASGRSQTPSGQPSHRPRTASVSVSQRSKTPVHHRANSSPEQLDQRSYTPSGQPSQFDQRSHTLSVQPGQRPQTASMSISQRPQTPAHNRANSSPDQIQPSQRPRTMSQVQAHTHAGPRRPREIILPTPLAQGPGQPQPRPQPPSTPVAWHQARPPQQFMKVPTPTTAIQKEGRPKMPFDWIRQKLNRSLSSPGPPVENIEFRIEPPSAPPSNRTNTSSTSIDPVLLTPDPAHQRRQLDGDEEYEAEPEPSSPRRSLDEISDEPIHDVLPGNQLPTGFIPHQQPIVAMNMHSSYLEPSGSEFPFDRSYTPVVEREQPVFYPPATFGRGSPLSAQTAPLDRPISLFSSSEG